MLLRKKLHFVKYVADAEAVVVSKSKKLNMKLNCLWWGVLHGFRSVRIPTSR